MQLFLKVFSTLDSYSKNKASQFYYSVSYTLPIHSFCFGDPGITYRLICRLLRHIAQEEGNFCSVTHSSIKSIYPIKTASE